MSGFCNARVWGGGHESCCRTKTDDDLCNAHQKASDNDALYLGLISESRPTRWGQINGGQVGLPKSLEGRRDKTIKWKNDPVEDWESARDQKKITKKTKNTKKSKKKSSGNHIQDLKDEIARLTESLKKAHESLDLAMKERDERVKSYIDKKANQLTKAELKDLLEGMESEEEEKEEKVVGLIYNSKGEEVGNITEAVDPVVVKKVSEMVSEIEASAPVDDGEATLAYESEQEDPLLDEDCENVTVDGKEYQLNKEDNTLIDCETYEEVGTWDKEKEVINFYPKDKNGYDKDITKEEIEEMIAIKEKAKEKAEKKEKVWEVSCIDFVGNQEADPEEEIFTFRTGPKGNPRMGEEYQIEKEEDMRATRMSDFESSWHLDKETRKLVSEDSDEEDSDEE